MEGNIKMYLPGNRLRKCERDLSDSVQDPAMDFCEHGYGPVGKI